MRASDHAILTDLIPVYIERFGFHPSEDPDHFREWLEDNAAGYYTAGEISGFLNG